MVYDYQITHDALVKMQIIIKTKFDYKLGCSLRFQFSLIGLLTNVLRALISMTIFVHHNTVSPQKQQNFSF